MMSESTALLEEEKNQTPLTEEKAVEEVPVDEHPVEVVLVEDQPLEEVIVEETSEEETPAEEPAEPENTAQESPAEEESAQESPAEESVPLGKQPSTGATSMLPYHERYYLRYREGKRTTELDLAGTKSFLQGIGFDGGELRQAREGKDFAERLRNTDKNRNNQMYCSYCGAEIAGVEFHRLPDGRLRCTSCSNTVVKTQAEIEEICRRVIANMDNFFGATIDVPVSIEVVEHRKLKRKIGVPLGIRDNQSMLILGVAINDRRKKTYSIMLENGAPRISLIATFAHELTHIWQYTHWDNAKNFKQCPKNKRLLIYEGMAKWAEIQYLYLIGETNIAKREEYITRNRKDEYGIGFCIYEDRYPLSREAMMCDDTPFTPGRYPFD
jgi:hypothetical protein